MHSNACSKGHGSMLRLFLFKILNILIIADLADN